MRRSALSVGLTNLQARDQAVKEAQVADTPKTLRTLLAEDPMSREAQEIAAQQRISTPQSRERLAAQTGTLGEQGYVVLPGLLSRGTVQAMPRTLQRLCGWWVVGAGRGRKPLKIALISPVASVG